MADSNQSFIPANKKIPEVTVKALVLGVILSVIMCAANAYLGLYAGMTVAASIPAAVVSMGILRGLLRRGTILENNIVQAMASSGESVAAGIIFTVPALVLVGAWTEFKFWPIVMISICGGILGVVFLVPLRRALIVEEDELVYPEGVACAEVLIAGEEGGTGLKPILFGLGIGAIMKFFSAGVALLKGSVELAGKFGNRIFVFGMDVSPALFGVGYIIRFEISLLVFMGGFIGWFVGIPLLSSEPMLLNMDSLDAAWMLWSTKVRYIGVGAMIVGGIWSIFSVREGIFKSIKRLIAGYSKVSDAIGSEIDRTDQDMKLNQMGIIILFCAAGTFFLYNYLINSVGYSLFTVLIMIIASFFLVAVSGYIVGLVGSSNNPVSGMLICTLFATAGLFLILDYKGQFAVVATLGVAGVAACAATSAGDMCQDLKTGELVGATPYKMQWAQMLGVISAAFVLPAVLTVLNNAYGIGTGLKAPQATLFASIVKAMFGDGELPWNMVYIGFALGVGLIILDQILKRTGSKYRAHVMPVAVGIYLPLPLTTPMLLGGIVRALVERKEGHLSKTESMHDYGVLMSSGLIAGESLMGIIIAILIGAKFGLPYKIFGNDYVSLGIMILMIAIFYRFTMKHLMKKS